MEDAFILACGPAYLWATSQATSQNKGVFRLEMTMQPILKGQRQTSLHKKAGELLYEGMTKEQICRVLDAINSERCTPPLSPGKLKHVKDFVMKWTKVISPDGEVTDVMG